MVLTEVLDIIEECERVKTIRFGLEGEASPGQFVMVWIPGVDEIPMSLSYTAGPKGITVEQVGEATKALHALRVGDDLGVRGPLGKGFSVSGKNVLVVGGGSGTACLAPLVERIVDQGAEVTCVIGAKTGSDIFFIERLERTGASVHRTTDDGSVGQKGLVTSMVKDVLSEVTFDQAYACGPEPMLVALVERCNGIDLPLQCSLERHMKCGIGLCGSCQLGPYTVCGDGPVFDSQILASIPDFGRFRRAPSGKRLPIG